MGFSQQLSRKGNYVTFMIMILILSTRFIEIEAMRPLKEDQLAMQKWLFLESLPKRGPATGTGASPCTFIPKSSKGRCTMEVKAVGIDKGSSAVVALPVSDNNNIQVVPSSKSIAKNDQVLHRV